ncbi:DNA phosphorothioation-associated putative methyltransferase [Desulfopila sp. IMCC35008]|uniref:DNA phosphorothioation-associated putative methyltransferase n=1 Tax=Desulfopila sp. IMCC35008 TaxID=2653858 RepID=UPI0013D45434|nr:DNA phosphorothioation-associated putative methyltransferase [Desulfopila sp. IMCC35008]
MDCEKFQSITRSISLGKKLPDAIYLHESALKNVSIELFRFVYEKIDEFDLKGIDWNVIKISKKTFRFSLLNYPSFFSESYPELSVSYLFDLKENIFQKRSYKNSKNPPILHRKEMFLAPDHHAVGEFKQLTKEGEEAGLYESPRTIGFKKGWEDVIAAKGYELIEGHLTKKRVSSDVPQKEIERHRTAIDRYSLSSPMQSLYRNGYLSGQYSVLDYGCGKGDDIRILNQHGLYAKGWDPVYFPEEQVVSSDIVNLGFVINVIEDQQERRETLEKAYQHAHKLLVIAVMLGGESITCRYQKHGDGVITSRNTFQKYYGQQEFRNYLEGVLSEAAIAVGPGVFYIFRDKIEEQKFLVEREKVKRNWKRLSYIGDTERLKVKQRAFYELNNKILDDFWDKSLELGRMPVDANEFTESESLRTLCGSHNKAFQFLLSFHDESILADAAKARQDDLLVYFSLGLFKQRKAYSKMPMGLKRDIKNFWGKYTNAIQEAREVLFSVGRTTTIAEACRDTYAGLEVGLLEEKAFTFHQSYLSQLPTVLRIYVGCATQLYGDLEGVDLIKIHINSGKVSLMRYEDFWESPLPLLVERIKIKMREQEIDFFEYGERFPAHPLYLKSQFMNPHMANYSNQTRFDQRIKTFKWLDLTGYGPKREEFDTSLETHEGLKVRGFRFYNYKA